MNNNGVNTKAIDKQDEIFRKMSADKKIKLWADFWLLAADLLGKKKLWKKSIPARS